jgi:hypothetical protein
MDFRRGVALSVLDIPSPLASLAKWDANRHVRFWPAYRGR